MNKLSNILEKSKNKVFFTALFFCLVLMGVYFFLFLSIKEKNRFVFVVNQELLDQLKSDREIKVVGTNLSETKINREKINSFFVPAGEVGVVEFVEELENIAKISETDMEVKTISFKEKEKDLVEIVSLSLAVKGGWNNVVNFFALLSDLPYALVFSRIQIEKNMGDEVVLDNWNAVFNIEVLKLKK